MLIFVLLVFALFVVLGVVGLFLLDRWWRLIPFVWLVAVIVAAILIFPHITACPCAQQPIVENTPPVACEAVACTPVACEAVACTPVACESVACTPVEPVVVAPVACDPSTIPFTDMGELNPNVETVIVGPAIYEWWTGGTNEGVQRVEAGYAVTIHGTAGHWWTLPNQAGLDCAWKLHVGNYAAKPQHAGRTIAQLIISPPVDLIK